ncbi:hypothetical protein [Herbaspirillum sp. NPDC101396]|uniref:hypothetical protein n=1 Tax=Herbaspirillum sp. NPDC101396 TaxID=3364005 RepID=UPI00383AE35D
MVVVAAIPVGSWRFFCIKTAKRSLLDFELPGTKGCNRRVADIEDSIDNKPHAKAETKMNHTYIHPTKGWVGKLLNALLNSVRLANVRRAFMSRLPFPVLESDVVDVVYANWLVDTSLAAALAPPGARLWDCNGRTPLTILTYRHGHFGPRAAGLLRRLMPSPLQSNWRLYLAEPLLDGPRIPTVAFVSNVMNSAIHVVGTRLFSDALPSHLPNRFLFEVGGDEACVCIDPGAGSAPGLTMSLRRQGEASLPLVWRTMFGDWNEAVGKLASQDAAVVEFPSANAGQTKVAIAAIRLPIDIHSVEPLSANREDVQCALLQSLRPDAEGLFFLLPRVKFLALSERQLLPPDV